VLFSLDHIDRALSSFSTPIEDNFRESVGYGPDNDEVRVSSRTYQAGKEAKLTLAYPVTGQDQSYMYIDAEPYSKNNSTLEGINQ